MSFGAVEVLNRVVNEIGSLDLEKFVDQARVLPLVDLIVSHGGTGSVLGALANGLPQLIMPQGADQFFNAQFLTEAGAALATERRTHTGRHPTSGH